VVGCDALPDQQFYLFLSHACPGLYSLEQMKSGYFDNQEIIPLICSSSSFAFPILHKLLKINLFDKFRAESGQIFWIITNGGHDK
jgi:hypothetical protein